MGEEFKQLLFRVQPKVKDKFERKCKSLGEDMSVVVRKLVMAFNEGLIDKRVLQQIDPGMARGRPPKIDDWSD